MSNLIRRQDAIDLIEQFYAFESKSEQIALQIAMRDLPSAQPEPHTGHWEPVGVAEVVGGESAMWGSAIAYHKCSQCGEQALEEYGEEKLSDFCPNCGAKMEVTE